MLYDFKGNKYVTTGVQGLIPLPLQEFMWEAVINLEERDYLQVFTLYVDDEGNQVIKHTQELHRDEEEMGNPEMYETFYKLGNVTHITTKIYVIDDVDYCTMLLAEEY